jgi:hypothetical protein
MTLRKKKKSDAAVAYCARAVTSYWTFPRLLTMYGKLPSVGTTILNFEEKAFRAPEDVRSVLHSWLRQLSHRGLVRAVSPSR